MSTVLDLFDRAWLPADLGALPADLGRRVEIVDGLLVVSPRPALRHGFVVDELTAVLRAAAPAEWHVTGSMGIAYGHTYRVPDVAVVRRSAVARAETLAPADVALAVEVEWPNSTTTDRITKPAEYAASGIAHYWRVELDPLRLLAHRLDAGSYERVGVWEAGGTARLEAPFAVGVDLARLLPGRQAVP